MSNKLNNPTTELKSLFKELVSITTIQTDRRDWAIIIWKSQLPFNQFTLISLMK